MRCRQLLAPVVLLVAAGCHAASSTSPAVNAREEPQAQSSEAAAAPEAAPTPVAPNAPVSGAHSRVTAFFSGHSLLDNPMPDWVELIAQSRGDSLGWEEQIVLGSPIRVRTRGDDPDASSWPGFSLGKSKSGKGIDVLAELKSPTALSHGEKYERLLITER